MLQLLHREIRLHPVDENNYFTCAWSNVIVELIYSYNYSKSKITVRLEITKSKPEVIMMATVWEISCSN